jgi:transposase
VRRWRDYRPTVLGPIKMLWGGSGKVDGCPVAIEVFDGNVADPATLANQVKKLKERFALERVVLVGDRGMMTSATCV